MPYYDDQADDQYQYFDPTAQDGMGGGGYDPTLYSGGYMDPNNPLAQLGNAMYSDRSGPYDVMGGGVPYDPSPIGTTLDQSGGPSDPGFQGTDPYGNPSWVDNPGYDPSTVNQLPTNPTYSNPSLNPDPGNQPTGGTGTPDDPYQFSTTGTGKMPSDPTNPTIGEPPPAPGYKPTPFPTNIGTGIQKPYPPTGPMTLTGPVRTPPTAPPVGPPRTPPTSTNQPAPQAPKTSAPVPAGNVNFSMGGLPGISSALPSASSFNYQPIAIARQGAPNQPPLTPPPDFTQGNLGGPLGPFSNLNPYARLRQQTQQKSPYDPGL